MGRVPGSVLGRSVRLSAALALLSAAVAQQGGTPVFTTDVALVTLPVTARDREGPLPDLGLRDFEVLEDGREVEISVFERRTNRPLSVVVMLDTSLSTAIQLSYEKDAAGRFLDRLLSSEDHPLDMAAVYSFSSEVLVLADFARDRKRLATALGRARPGTGTSVYNAISLASDELAGRTGRRVMILITDGGDTTSAAGFDDAMKAAHLAEAAIYPLIVLPIRSDAGRNRGGEHALITLAGKTGGEAFVQYGAGDLDASFDEVLRRLRTQYLLGFYPRAVATEGKGGFRAVEVRVLREGGEALVRSGYYVPVATSAPDPSGNERTAPDPVTIHPRGKASPPRQEPKAPPAKPPVRPPLRDRGTLPPRR